VITAAATISAATRFAGPGKESVEMTGGNEGGRPLTQTQPTKPNQPRPGSQVGNDVNRDQEDPVRDRGDQMSQKPSGRPDDNSLQDDEDGVGTTTNPGSEGATRY
jgi:hypothetical protein